MNSREYGFSRWCDNVTSYIYYPADREDVKKELMWHLEDIAETLAEQGLREEEISQKAIGAMGDPEELGLLLRRVHKPWLGWLHFGVKLLAVVLVFALCISLVLGTHFLRTEIKHLFRPEVTRETYYGYYWGSHYSDGGELAPVIAELKGGAEFECGIYNFRVEGGWIEDSDFAEGCELYIVLHYSSPRFWEGSPHINMLEAHSDTGDLYSSRSPRSLFSAIVSESSTAVGEYVIILTDIRPGTKWVDISGGYGEGFDFRVYLPEGGGWT